MIKRCKDCGVEFETRIRISGRVVRCDKRQRCFECFPYAEGNSRGIDLGIVENEIVVCYLCSTQFTYDIKQPTKLCPVCREDKYVPSCACCSSPYKINRLHHRLGIFNICSVCLKKKKSKCK